MTLTFPSLDGHKEIQIKKDGDFVLFTIGSERGKMKITDLYSFGLTVFTPEQLDKIMIEKMIEVTESKRQMKLKATKNIKKGEEIVVTYTQTVPNLITQSCQK